MSAVARIAKALGLPADGQDWGIEHADPDRLQEFLAFTQAYAPEYLCELELLAELIFQSAEEAYGLHGVPGELQAELIAFVRSRHHLFPNTYRHWWSLPESDWHVARLLKGRG